MIKAQERQLLVRPTCALAEMKAKQSAKIAEIRQALVASGFLTLDEQARALGLGRSTTWSVLRANYKASGLSAALINRMWASPQIPALVRAKILEYVENKAAGLYGHQESQRRKFTRNLAIKLSRSPR